MGLRIKDFAPWIKKRRSQVEGDVRVLASRPGVDPLWQQLTSFVDGEVTDVSVAGAFFDSRCEFLSRVQKDLKPNRLFVAVDPNTVQLPNPKDVRALNAKVVRADTLGTDPTEEEESKRYLHAKGLLVETKKGIPVFASGSANPSAPAWLATTDSGNVELMLTLRGEDAARAANNVGFDTISAMPPLCKTDWKTIQDGQSHDKDDVRPEYITGLAIAEDSKILIRDQLTASIENLEVVLVSPDNREVGRSKELEVQGELIAVEFEPEQLGAATILQCLLADEIKAKFLIHHSKLVEGQARTGEGLPILWTANRAY